MFSNIKVCSNIHILGLYLHFLILSCSAFTSKDYAHALKKSLIFFEGQRSGRLPHNHRVKWRRHSGLSDGSDYHVDLVGGYYDAGDNVKFGLPMAFTTTLLAWSVIEFGSSMHKLEDKAKDAVRWGADYLLKAATATPGALYVQVGDPISDHRCWERPEDMDTARTAYRVTPQSPGSDVAAETAAALAASSIVFKDSDPSYSNKLLQIAREVFVLQIDIKGLTTMLWVQLFAHITAPTLDSIFPLKSTSNTCHLLMQDELLWGASWLHRASKDNLYLAYLQSNGHTLGADDNDYTFSWDDKRAGAKILLAKGFFEDNIQEFKQYKSHADDYICSLIPGSPNFQHQYTPGGLFYERSESNLQYATSTSFLLLTYAKYLKSHSGTTSCGSTTITSGELVALANKQVDYILGDNPKNMSYMVGFGPRYPEYIHHRGSSLPSVHAHRAHISCGVGFDYLRSGSPNPNILVGAIVGGPDKQDNFVDTRNNYQQSEPATYINAPFVGAVAFFAHYK